MFMNSNRLDTILREMEDKLEGMSVNIENNNSALEELSYLLEKDIEQRKEQEKEFMMVLKSITKTLNTIGSKVAEIDYKIRETKSEDIYKVG